LTGEVPPPGGGAALFVVLPAYNEAEAVPRLLRRFEEVRASLPARTRILLVDDGSADATAEAAAAAAGALDLAVLRHPTNRGLCAGLDTGFRRALASASPRDLVVTMDADDTHPPDLIASMIASASAGADVVIASRFRAGAVWRGLNWRRVLFSYGASGLFRVLYPIRGVRDYTCGYRLYRASVLMEAYQRWGDRLLAERSFAGMLALLLRVARLGPRIAEVPLDLHYDRKPGPSKMDVGRTIRRTLVMLVRARLGRFD
jgi:dolichol-phosphate mannosyltransferase